MDIESILERIERLEYHQSLLLEMISGSSSNFNRLIIEKSLKEGEVKQFLKLCDELNIKMEKQKAEGFVYLNPLFKEFSMKLPSNTQPEDVIKACIDQGLYLSLMLEFKKYL